MRTTAEQMRKQALKVRENEKNTNLIKALDMIQQTASKNGRFEVSINTTGWFKETIEHVRNELIKRDRDFTVDYIECNNYLIISW